MRAPSKYDTEVKMENIDFIKNAIRFIRSNAGQPDLSIDEIAKGAGFTTDYFNRLFSMHTGFNIMEYVRFRRLNKAAYLLRTSDRDILDIALECGYEAHESFTRAFKKQYGKTPTEYRERMNGVGMKYADIIDTTAGARFLRAHPEFHTVDRDLVIDTLLERDSLRLGYAAITLDWNGSMVVADDMFDSGTFIAIDDFGGTPSLTLFAADLAALTALVRKVTSETSFGVILYDDYSCAQIADALRDSEYADAKIKLVEEYTYLGEPFVISETQPGYTIKELHVEDIPQIKEWAKKRKGGNDWGLERDLTMRDVHHANDAELVFGLYHHEELVAVARGALQSTHGYRLNNCIDISSNEELSDELSLQLYQNTANAAIACGYLLYDDTSSSEYIIDSCSPQALGFKHTGQSFSINK